MAGQLLPPPELAPPIRMRTTPQQRLAMWCDLLDTCEQFLLAGLRRKVGPVGDLQAAYRDWYTRQTREHDRMMQRMLEQLHERGGGNAVLKPAARAGGSLT